MAAYNLIGSGPYYSPSRAADPINSMAAYQAADESRWPAIGPIPIEKCPILLRGDSIHNISGPHYSIGLLVQKNPNNRIVGPLTQ